jgi:hypothetical protein
MPDSDPPMTPEQRKALFTEHQEDAAMGKEKTIQDTLRADMDMFAAILKGEHAKPAAEQPERSADQQPEPGLER